jgi:hypothetical protein
MNWTIERIKQKLSEIKLKGYIDIPSAIYRRDEGVVGQILEREFDVKENNLRIRDLGDFELKGLRKRSNTPLTLCHSTTTRGLKPLQIFERFSYLKPSQDNPLVMKRKLFMTIKGDKLNRGGFILRSSETGDVDMYWHDEFICGWSLADSLEKAQNVIVVYAETKGKTKSLDEQFHFTDAFLLTELYPLHELIKNKSIAIDFCIDQPEDRSKPPHDRGPHIRIPKSKLFEAYKTVCRVL